jgi:acetoacetyl-CoA reductase
MSSKTCLITGTASGMGRLTATAAAQAGMRLICVDIDLRNGTAACEEIIAATGNREVEFIECDLSSQAHIQKLAARVNKDYDRLDILVNNAGITRDKSFKKMSFEEWHKVIDTNLSSAFNTCKVALPSMLEQKYGRIINISSVIGQSGGFGQSNYAAAKAGLIGFTKSLALETAKAGITANCICPGYIATEMVAAMPEKVLEAITAQVPMKKLGDPEEIAKGVLFVCESEYMTGQCINLNGGLYML